MDEQLNAREQGDIKNNEGAMNSGGKTLPTGRIERIRRGRAITVANPWLSWAWQPCSS